MRNAYDERYEQPGYYWGKAPSQMCYRLLQLLPPDRPLRLIDIGCGEGRNAVFFARNGYRVTAFDASPRGVEKTKQLAADAGVTINAFVADINVFRLTEPFMCCSPRACCSMCHRHCGGTYSPTTRSIPCWRPERLLRIGQKALHSRSAGRRQKRPPVAIRRTHDLLS
jgi:SAM-dependent methyltransferase